MSRWYGSVQNRIEEQMRTIKPEVGMGATMMGYTDRTPYEIIEVKDERHITVRALNYKRIDTNGMSESQEYEYTSDENNATSRLFLTKQGQWRERYNDRSLGRTFVIGYAEKYHDFSF